MTSSTPASTDVPPGIQSHRHRPSRWIASLLATLAIVAACSRALAASADDATSLQQTADATQRAWEQTQRDCQANQELLRRLETGRDNPTQLVPDATLLEAHPTVCQLQQAWTAAESNMAQLLLTMRQSHPRVQACDIERQELRQQLNSELDAAIRGAQARQSQLDAQADSLSAQAADMQQRLQQLAATQTESDSQLSLVPPPNSEPQPEEKSPSDAHYPQTTPLDAAPPQAVEPPATPASSGGTSHTLFAAVALAGGLLITFGLYALRGSRLTTAPPAVAVPAAPVPTAPASSPSPPAVPAPRTSPMTLTQALKRWEGK